MLFTNLSMGFTMSKNLWGSHFDEAYSITTDASDNIYTTGVFRDSVDFDPGVDNDYHTADWDDIFVQKMDPAGNYLWTQTFGGSYTDCGYSITVDTFENILITGRFGRTVDFDPLSGINNHTSNGLWDVFVAKWKPCMQTSSTINETVCESYISPNNKVIFNLNILS